MTGRELHEGDDMIKQGLRVVSHMYTRVKGSGKKYKLKFSLEESPAESASRRLAKVDVRNYPEAVTWSREISRRMNSTTPIVCICARMRL